jgi:hypothetical protein
LPNRSWFLMGHPTRRRPPPSIAPVCAGIRADASGGRVKRERFVGGSIADSLGVFFSCARLLTQ